MVQPTVQGGHNQRPKLVELFEKFCFKYLNCVALLWHKNSYCSTAGRRLDMDLLSAGWQQRKSEGLKCSDGHLKALQSACCHFF